VLHEISIKERTFRRGSPRNTRIKIGGSKIKILPLISLINADRQRINTGKTIRDLARACDWMRKQIVPISRDQAFI
jgi:hypothetical protein